MERSRSPQPDPRRPLKPVPLQELRLLAEGRRWRVDQRLDELASLTPVRGTLAVRHTGQVLEVEGDASTSITLCCDRCLRPFHQVLAFRTRELIGLGEADPFDLEGLDDGLCDQLDPRGSFDPARWLFEHLSLQLPLRNHCGPACPGPCRPPGSPAAAGAAGDLIDPRWASLRPLR